MSNVQFAGLLFASEHKKNAVPFNIQMKNEGLSYKNLPS